MQVDCAIGSLYTQVYSLLELDKIKKAAIV